MIVQQSLCLVFRKPLRFFSIERIFSQLRPALEKQFAVTGWEAPSPLAGPGAMYANWRSARRCRADLYHVTGDIHYIVTALPRRRTLLTIHDCIFLYSSSGLKRRLLKFLFLDVPVRYCRLITTISEATKQDIIRNTGCDPEKIIVIPNPVDSMIRHVPARPMPAEPVILFIGSTPNKNLERVIAALEGVPCELSIVGKVSAEIMQALLRYGIRYKVATGLTDEEMAQKYTDADLVLFPSTFEGFGLPIVEGQKAGRPVITSDLSPMKDVAAGAACLVDPYNVDSIREGVLRVIRDTVYREQLVQDGLRNAERSSPERIAALYLDCYKRLLKE